jgi:hypothetical protein
MRRHEPIKNDDYALYEIEKNDVIHKVRVFSCSINATTKLEKEVGEIVSDGYRKESGEVGFLIDPYEVAEKILADHYGYAKMIEKHYEWQAGVIY